MFFIAGVGCHALGLGGSVGIKGQTTWGYLDNTGYGLVSEGWVSPVTYWRLLAGYGRIWNYLIYDRLALSSKPTLNEFTFGLSFDNESIFAVTARGKIRTGDNYSAKEGNVEIEINKGGKVKPSVNLTMIQASYQVTNQPTSSSSSVQDTLPGGSPAYHLCSQQNGSPGAFAGPLNHLCGAPITFVSTPINFERRLQILSANPDLEVRLNNDLAVSGSVAVVSINLPLEYYTYSLYQFAPGIVYFPATGVRVKGALLGGYDSASYTNLGVNLTGRAELFGIFVETELLISYYFTGPQKDARGNVLSNADAFWINQFLLSLSYKFSNVSKESAR